MYSETTEGPTRSSDSMEICPKYFPVFETALFQINTNFTLQSNILGI